MVEAAEAEAAEAEAAKAEARQRLAYHQQLSLLLMGPGGRW